MPIDKGVLKLPIYNKNDKSIRKMKRNRKIKNKKNKKKKLKLK